jgi:hypothetical protein
MLQLSQTLTKLDSAQADITAQQAKVPLLCATMCSHKNNNNNSSSCNNNQSPSIRKYFNDNYCWTHGYHIHGEHTSQMCKAPAEGHKCEAMSTNIMGGTDKYKHLSIT